MNHIDRSSQIIRGRNPISAVLSCFPKFPIQPHNMSILTRSAIRRFRYIYRTPPPRLISPRPIPKLFNGTTIDRFVSPSPFSTPLQWHFSSSYSSSSSSNAKDYPSGDFDFKPITGFNKYFVRLKTMLALPWERVQQGSILKINLQGKISDQLSNPDFTTLPQISDVFLKAKYDIRISAIYLSIYKLDYSWAILDEIRSEILNFKKSGKLVVAHLPFVITEKEYYLTCECDEIYAAPAVECSFTSEINPYDYLNDSSRCDRNLIELIEVQSFKKGKYKRAQDECTDYHREALKSLRDSIYSVWLDRVLVSRGYKREKVEKFVNKGIIEVGKLRDEGFISELVSSAYLSDDVKVYEANNMLKDDKEVINMLKERTKIKSLPLVLYEKYSRVRKSSAGIPGGKELIAVIRASGSISSVLNPPFTSINGIFAERIIEQIHRVKDSDRFKAVIIRVESLGGDALASALMLREIKLIKIPVVVSVVDAASGGYSIAMGGQTIVSGNLSLIGSIGVTADVLNYKKVYEKYGLTANILSRGKFSELHQANHHRLKPHEARLMDKITQNGYDLFRDTAADCRGMTVDEMEEIAQGRTWMGKEAVSLGLVDAIGGLSRAIAIAKVKSNISQDTPVTIVEIGSP